MGLKNDSFGEKCQKIVNVSGRGVHWIRKISWKNFFSYQMFQMDLSPITNNQIFRQIKKYLANNLLDFTKYLGKSPITKHQIFRQLETSLNLRLAPVAKLSSTAGEVRQFLWCETFFVKGEINLFVRNFTIWKCSTYHFVGFCEVRQFCKWNIYSKWEIDFSRNLWYENAARLEICQKIYRTEDFRVKNLHRKRVIFDIC